MADVARARRLAVRIREVVATTLERQVKDPRLGMVTITDARVTPDLREATVYYTVYGDEVTRADSAAALESARGVLRTQVGRQTGVRYTPSLTFVADTVPKHADRIEDLIRRAHEADAQVEKAREGATYAGDPDPYRTAEPAVDAESADTDSTDPDSTDVDPGAGGASRQGLR
jgi:ribosome-binding factor A